MPRIGQLRHQSGLFPFPVPYHSYWTCELGWPSSEAKSPDPPKFHCNDGNPRTHRADQSSRIVLFFLWFFDRICHHFHHYLAALRYRAGRFLEVLQDAD